MAKTGNPVILNGDQVQAAKVWLVANSQPQYHQAINDAPPGQVQGAIAKNYPGGVKAFIQECQPESHDLTLEINGPGDYHRNINPIGYFNETEGTARLAQQAGAFFQHLDVQQRICLMHLASFFIIKQTLNDVTIDSRIPSVIDPEIGAIVQGFRAAEWMAVVGVILENTNPAYMDADA